FWCRILRQPRVCSDKLSNCVGGEGIARALRLVSGDFRSVRCCCGRYRRRRLRLRRLERLGRSFACGAWNPLTLLVCLSPLLVCLSPFVSSFLFDVKRHMTVPYAVGKP